MECNLLCSMKEPWGAHIPVWAIHRSIWHYNTSKCTCCLFTCKIYTVCIYIYIDISGGVYFGEPRLSVNPEAKSTFEELLYFIHINTLRSQKCLERKCLKTFKHQNTFKHIIQCFQIQRLPIHGISQLNPTPGFGYPKNPHRKHGKTAPFHPFHRWTPPRTFGHEAPTR